MRIYKLVFLGLCLLCLGLDIQAILLGHMIAGVFLLITTLSTVVASYIWMIQREDYNFYIQKTFLVIPISLIAACLIKFHPNQFNGVIEKPNLMEVGQLLMSRYQAALWVLGMLILASFIFAGAVLDRRKN